MNRVRHQTQSSTIFAFSLLISFVSFSAPCLAQGKCVCSTDGMSNGVQTDSPGCALHYSLTTEPYCFVKDSMACPDAVASSEFPGAATIPCSVEEALFDAAKFDDVASIAKFRELGASLNISRDVPYGDDGSRVVSLIVFAAAHGSFQTVEDLLANEDFNCEDDTDLQNQLCYLSKKQQCQSEDSARMAISSFIDSVVVEKCSNVQVEFPLTAEVVRSVDVPCGQHSYFASVRLSSDDENSHICSAVLISKQTVLTAAHCISGISNPALIIDPECTHEVRKGTKILIHPNWFKGSQSQMLGNGYDIALIKLNKPSKKTPIKIQKKGTVKTGDALTVIGLGRQSENSGFASRPQQGIVSVESKTTCQKDYDTTLSKNILCAGRETEHCYGDGGAPLINTESGRDELVGIAHEKDPSDICGTADLPGLYIDATRLAKWIKKKSKKL